MSEPTVAKVEGTLSYVDSKGNVTEMYPEIKEEYKTKFKRALYVESFDSETGVLNTVSD